MIFITRHFLTQPSTQMTDTAKTTTTPEENAAIDLVFSFDTTGSMYPCLTQVRNKISEITKTLMAEIPDLRIGVIAHGDYCDARTSYVTRQQLLTNDQTVLQKFITTTSATYGGDAPECYELVLNEARGFNWRADAKKVLIVIGDDEPHAIAHNPRRLDWKAEAKELLNLGVVIHGVQCMNRSRASYFYQGIASITGGIHIPLSQFNDASNLVMAIAYHQGGEEQLTKFEEKVKVNNGGTMTTSMRQIFAALRRDPDSGRYVKVDARSTEAGRFQMIAVPTDSEIREFVQAQGLVFSKGKGYYEFTKKETIQAKKQVVIMDRNTGEIFEGAAVRQVLGLSDANADIRPTYDKAKYRVFVQSTSVNRKLQGGTLFLYEAE